MKENKEKLRILMKKVGLDPEVKYIEDTLKAKQELVKGLIEVCPYIDNTVIICNEENKLLGLPPNSVFENDYILGDYFVVGDDYENAGFKSLTDEQIEQVTADIKKRSFKFTEKELKKIHNNHSLEFVDDYIRDIVIPIDELAEEHIFEEYEKNNH